MTTPIKTISPALAAPVIPSPRIFYGELPPAISYLTATAKPIFFYQGYHVSEDPEVIEYCKTLRGVADVTDQIDVANVPQPALRTRSRNWASTEKTSMTPGELLSRAVRVASTSDLGGNSAASNSTV
jgi:hypothetical protein